MEVRGKRKSRKIKWLLLSLSLIAVVIVVMIFVVKPSSTVIDDINRFDELKLGNKVIFGFPSCNNTWRVEKKDGTRVLLVNEKCLKDNNEFTKIYGDYFSSDSMGMVLPKIGPRDLKYPWVADDYANRYLNCLNGKYLSGVFSLEDQDIMCEIAPEEFFFIRAKYNHLFVLDITKDNVFDYEEQLNIWSYEYYPAVWIDTAKIKPENEKEKGAWSLFEDE